MGSRAVRPLQVDWSIFDLPSVRNRGLDNPFSEEEVWEAIKASPAEKAPGPDEFSGVFYRSCWSIIKGDIMAVFSSFYNLTRGDFGKLNTALVILLPKKDGATTTRISDLLVSSIRWPSSSSKFSQGVFPR